jgi:hypothetical protein
MLLAASSAAPVFAQWGPVPAQNAPAPRSGPLLAYDPLQNRTLMFGGNWTNEFWSLAGGAWTQLTPATLPQPRGRANLVANPVSGELLLYGGDSTSGQFALDETWTWNGTDWQLRSSQATPGGLARHAMAFDLSRMVAVLFGGRRNSWQSNVISPHTWEWSPTTGEWTQATPLHAPPPALDAAISYHPNLGKVVMYGGQDSGGSALGDTWIYDGITWQMLMSTGPQPSPRVGARMVPILGRGTCILFGGRDPATMVIANDTWEFDGANWTQINGVYGGAYPPRADFGMAHDFSRDRIVLVGGQTASTAALADTWEFGAQFQPFGMGCAGTGGVPQLSANGMPVIGSTFTATIGNLPPTSTFAAMMLGLSRTQWQGGSLPALLTSQGMPNCRLYTSAELLVGLTASGGQATWSYSFPMQPALLGDTYYLQGLSLDPPANAAWLTVSNAATLVVGY